VYIRARSPSIISDTAIKSTRRSATWRTASRSAEVARIVGDPPWSDSALDA